MHLLNVSYDPTRELYQEFNQAFADDWKQKTGQTVTIEQSHGGLRQTSSLGDRWPAGRRRDAGCRIRYRRHRRQSACHQPGLGNPSAEQRHTVHLDYRVPGSQGQSQGHSRLAGRHPERRQRHHAESQDVQRRPLELSRGLGLRLEPQRTRRKKDPRVHRGALQERSGAGFGRARLNHHVRRTRLGRRPALLGERSSSGAQGIRRGQIRDRESIVQHSGRAARWLWSTSMSINTGRAPWPRRISNSCTRTPARRSPRRTSTGRESPAALAKYKSQFPDIQLFTITDVAGPWKEVQPKHFADHGIFDQLYQPQS